jgi:hypothetical protein
MKLFIHQFAWEFFKFSCCRVNYFLVKVKKPSALVFNVKVILVVFFILVKMPQAKHAKDLVQWLFRLSRKPTFVYEDKASSFKAFLPAAKQSAT